MNRFLLLICVLFDQNVFAATTAIGGFADEVALLVDPGGQVLFEGPPSSMLTFEAMVQAPWILEMSKNSICRGRLLLPRDALSPAAPSSVILLLSSPV